MLVSRQEVAPGNFGLVALRTIEKGEEIARSPLLAVWQDDYSRLLTPACAVCLSPVLHVAERIRTVMQLADLSWESQWAYRCSCGAMACSEECWIRLQQLHAMFHCWGRVLRKWVRSFVADEAQVPLASLATVLAVSAVVDGISPVQGLMTSSKLYSFVGAFHKALSTAIPQTSLSIEQLNRMVEIADKVAVEVDIPVPNLPTSDVPEGHSKDAMCLVLRLLCEGVGEGIAGRQLALQRVLQAGIERYEELLPAEMLDAASLALDSTLPALSSPAVMGLALATVAGQANHSCEPNAAVSIAGVHVALQSLRPIYMGEEVSISYVPAEDDLDARQSVLQMKYDFKCHCARCSL
ncbi:MAG: hypothetical protein KVP17_001177 [Porospora cf. gigantea B]|uniref:uncharacterized protein n=1 Tax=Porospora cf. gigantea B TaxID=2853592 RepID=UPI003571E94A|nr:MAG: hypothetical protein KVP17_001177 [Porospora cf. gigantea B]